MISKEDKKLLLKLGARIKMLREQNGLSTRDVSYACSIDNSKISKIERGLVNITFTTIKELAKGMNVHPMELLDFEFEE